MDLEFTGLTSRGRTTTILRLSLKIAVLILVQNIDGITLTYTFIAEDLNKHKIHALEAYFHSEILSDFEFKLSLNQLKNSIVEKSSHSLVRARKKIDVEHEIDLGKKVCFMLYEF